METFPCTKGGGLKIWHIYGISAKPPFGTVIFRSVCKVRYVWLRWGCFNRNCLKLWYQTDLKGLQPLNLTRVADKKLPGKQHMLSDYQHLRDDALLVPSGYVRRVRLTRVKVKLQTLIWNPALNKQADRRSSDLNRQQNILIFRLICFLCSMHCFLMEESTTLFHIRADFIPLHSTGHIHNRIITCFACRAPVCDLFCGPIFRQRPPDRCRWTQTQSPAAWCSYPCSVFTSSTLCSRNEPQSFL